MCTSEAAFFIYWQYVLCDSGHRWLETRQNRTKYKAHILTKKQTPKPPNYKHIHIFVHFLMSGAQND